MTRPARWYVLVDGEQTGPFGLAVLRERVLAGALTPTTWVWADGMPEWRPARRVPALVPPPGAAAPGDWPTTAEDA